jgi:uncharacterized protein YecT (DUF1311 family)
VKLAHGLALLLLLASGSAFARNCEEGAANKSEMLDCLYQESQKIVDDAYRPLYAELKQHDPATAAALQKSQASWEKFADDSCSFYILIADGEIPTDAQVNCWNDFANARARVLKAWLKKVRAQRS